MQFRGRKSKIFTQKVREIQVGIIFFCLLVYVGLCYVGVFKENDVLNERTADTSEFKNIKAGSRSLLSVLPNCTPRAIEQFPRDVFTTAERKQGAIILHVAVTIYMFLGFALLCDDYFVPSLEVICEVLHIQSDVAGATFMAAGSSAPELATAVISIFIAKDDIGIGTVVGSAVYNVMFVISICALCAGMVVNLNWWPLCRDCLFYTISVAALALVIMDEQVFWYEAVIFIILYLVYILLMYFNTSLEMWIVPKFTCCGIHKKADNLDVVVMVTRNKENGQSSFTNAASNDHLHVESKFIGQDTSDFDSDFEDDGDDTNVPLMRNSSLSNKQQESTQEKTEHVLSIPETWWKKAIWGVSLPLKLLFYITIPDCRYTRWRSCFIVTFIMSLVWLSFLSYLMVWMITIIGYTAGIADTIMGLTFIAFGVSLPDVISSVIVVREGLGDMAVSNAVGSNVFDILICLGLPWLIQCLIKGKSVQVYSQGLLYATLTLLATVIFLLFSTHINGWRLTKKFGLILLLVYVLFTILTSLYELNVFGYVHPKECVSNY
ncbi:probable sodium/potassium/calcium exchanger CG1090 [Ruditapes philippinarum]|uniref:probable sodium/potassium/calcium exchanger CG1090 n=1 Tax=Ruditapes philippinarum TaxID=129788 RepID=UPI00295B8013|nr:probable sodium/potassium/calcium exchanger CG1090 [Ruditapes philippinarum]